MAGNRTERIRGAVLEQYLYDECNRLLQITDGADTEYYGAAEPPVRCGESHLS
ncbi:hypothetical protein G4493_20060, partial [Roseburia intestinalis]|nr:hypothetical protein [Roseburia intestinalis]